MDRVLYKDTKHGGYMKQFTVLVAMMDFSFKVPGAKGRAVNVREGDRFVVTSPKHSNITHALIAREKRAILNTGYKFALTTLKDLFAEVE